MEHKAELLDISRDWKTGKTRLLFLVDGKPEEAEKYTDKKLRLKAVEWKEKRSLDANAYFHVLVGKISEALTLSKARTKNILICRYGQPELLEDGNAIVYETKAPVSYMLEKEDIHAIPCGYRQINGTEKISYRIYRGSHTYDTYEMSKLIDGTIAEARELGIETLPPDELERMMKAYEEKHRTS